MAPYMKMFIPIGAGLIPPHNPATSVDPLETHRSWNIPQDSESPSRLRLCPLAAASLGLIYHGLAGAVLCAQGNKGGLHLGVTKDYFVLWGPQRTEVPTTSGKKGHIIAGHTPLSQLAVLGRHSAQS